jgi:hypothetical protein
MREDSLSVNSFHTSGSSPTARCRVGLLGLGTAGRAAARRVTGEPAFATRSHDLTHIFDCRAHGKRETFTPPLGPHAAILNDAEAV